MVTVRFSVFTDKLRDGTKRQTIRRKGAYLGLKVGSPIHCYSVKKILGLNRPVDRWSHA